MRSTNGDDGFHLSMRRPGTRARGANALSTQARAALPDPRASPACSGQSSPSTRGHGPHRPSPRPPNRKHPRSRQPCKRPSPSKTQGCRLPEPKTVNRRTGPSTAAPKSIRGNGGRQRSISGSGATDRRSHEFEPPRAHAFIAGAPRSSVPGTPCGTSRQGAQGCERSPSPAHLPNHDPRSRRPGLASPNSGRRLHGSKSEMPAPVLGTVDSGRTNAARIGNQETRIHSMEGFGRATELIPAKTLENRFVRRQVDPTSPSLKRESLHRIPATRTPGQQRAPVQADRVVVDAATTHREKRARRRAGSALRRKEGSRGKVREASDRATPQGRSTHRT